MYKMKKLFAFLLAFTMLMSCTSIFANEVADAETVAAKEAEIEAQQAKNDAENKELLAAYAEEINLLHVLGVLTDRDITMNDTISRGEFLNLVMKMLKMNLAYSEKETVFYDVVEGSTYWNSVMNAYKLGIVNGNGNAYFYPEKETTYEAAIKMLVSGLGYRSLAEAKGGYSLGYVKVARELDIASSVNVDGVITWGGAITLLFESLHAKSPSKSYSGDGQVQITTGDETFIHERYGVDRYIGVVEDTDLTLRMNGEENDETVLVINGRRYEGFSLSAAEGDRLLGKSVAFYYNEDSEESICVSEEKGANKSVLVDAENIASASGTSSVTYYDENESRRTANIPSDAKVFYNGVRCFDLENKDLTPDEGNIEFIDNDGGGYDYVIIKSYRLMALSRTASDKLVSIYNDGEEGKPYEINLNDTEMVFYKDGNEVTKYHLGEWSVLNLMLAKNKRAGLAEVSYAEMAGKVNGQITQDGKTCLEIDGKAYELTDLFVEAYTRKDFSAPEPKIGNTYFFALDGRNRIVGIKTNATTKLEYGVLVGVANNSPFDKNSCRVKIFGMYGTWIEADLADNVKVNGERRINLMDKIDALNNAVPRGDRGVVQLVQYSLNTDGEIAQINVAEDRRAAGYDHDVFSLDDANTPGASWDYVTAISKVWTSTAAADPDRQDHFVDSRENAPLFYVPADKGNEDEYVFAMAYGNFNRYTAAKTDVEIYDTRRYSDEYDIDRIGALVVYGRDGDTYTWSSLKSTGLPGDYFIVDHVAKAVDNNGDIGTSIDVICTADGGEYSYFFTEDAINADTTNSYGYGDVSPEELETGDVVVLTYNSPYIKEPRIHLYGVLARASDYSNDLISYTRFYDATYNNDLENYIAAKKQFPNNAVIVGEVVHADDFGLILQAENENSNGEKVFFSTLNNGQTYEYSVDGEYFEKSTPAVIGKGDRIVARGNFNGYNPSWIIRIVE